MGQAASNPVSRRRLRRYAIAVPIDVVALRSGVPASIPGRTLDVSEGGVATVLAGELSPGEPVGVEFRLPAAREAIQAKAIVRHSSLMRCGLQFLAMSVEQENALRSWTEMADRAAVRTIPNAVSATLAAGSVRNAKPVKRSHGLRWAVMSAGVVAVVLAVVAWWSWNTGWHELESDGTGNAAAVPLDVSSSVMGQRIIHKVDPIYPSDALKAKIQGQVTLEALISEDGTVRDVYAVSGPEALRSAASDAVKWWRFEPYRVDGRAAAVHTLIEVDFRLER